MYIFTIQTTCITSQSVPMCADTLKGQIRPRPIHNKLFWEHISMLKLAHIHI